MGAVGDLRGDDELLLGSDRLGVVALEVAALGLVDSSASMGDRRCSAVRVRSRLKACSQARC
jgi:hypothetical protein